MPRSDAAATVVHYRYFSLEDYSVLTGSSQSGVLEVPTRERLIVSLVLRTVFPATDSLLLNVSPSGHV